MRQPRPARRPPGSPLALAAVALQAIACARGATPDGGRPADAGDAGDLVVETVASGLEVPWELRFLPDGTLLATERPGRLVRVRPDTGAVDVVATFDVTTGGERGLMGLALHPDFPDTPALYVCYTRGDENRISRLTWTGDDAEDEEVLLGGIPAAPIHDGCRLGFGPDGLLYATTGDAGDAARAQDPESLNGKVLRLTPGGEVPADNPRPGSYVFTLGHRNPQGLDFQPGTGRPYVTEHGPNVNDEVNRLEAGGNYGWPEVGGAPGDPRYVDAVYAWSPTIAPAGAVFYAGDALPAFTGAFLLVTLKEQDLRRLVPADDAFTAVASETIYLDEALGRLRALRVGPDGWLYLSTSNRDGRGRPDASDDRIVRIRAR